MNVAEALSLIGLVGAVESSGGKLRLKFPEREYLALQPAIDTLRIGKAEALTQLAGSTKEQLAAAASTTSTQTEIDLAVRTLNASGVRILQSKNQTTIGVWSDLDSPEIRAALRTLGMDHLQVSYLDGAGIPLRYKVRQVGGEPVAMSVLARMKMHSTEPWKARRRR